MSILIDENTTFIVQGITGREAVNLTRECIDYGSGAKVVGGVTPGRKGREVHGVPVFDTVQQAVENHGGPIKGSVVTVPPAFTKDAVFEAIENGIELIVIVTERIPRRDVAQMVELATLHGARIIGPNCLGIIVPDVIKMGGIGGPGKKAAHGYTPGPGGGISRSGRMTTEMPGMSFGHAGTIVEGKEDTATEKIARLGEAGITVAERIEDIPDLVRQGIASRKGATV